MSRLFKLSVVMFLVLGLSVPGFARTPDENLKQPYYQIKHSIYQNMPRDEGSIVFLGDSLTDYIRFEEILPDMRIKNRGIAGDSTVTVLYRLDEVLSLKPSKLFLMIGTNDIVYGMTSEETLQNIRKIIERFREVSPDTRIYVETIFPVNHKFTSSRPSEAIRAINAGLADLAPEMNCELIDTYSYFAEDGELPERYTVDGIHMNGAGIVRWVEFLSKWIKEK
ncbi:MAG: hypothetical protein IJR85_07760 [Synergistaceae bacterium]|nr:hypothetical protein [Synergistaceae bacterium]